MAEKKLSKKALNKSFRNWFYGHLTCFSQEHMQTFGYLCAMLPLVEELYDTREEQTEALKTYSAFFNTEPQLGTVVIGAVAASWISITTPLVLPGDISLQKDVLDTIFPKMLPLATVMLCYWLMSKKKMAPTTVMLVLVGIALVGVLVGFFDPQLAY